MAFYYFNRNIPDEAHQKIGSLGPSGVSVFAMTPQGGWVLVANGGYFARGIPDECFEKLGAFLKDGHVIRCIAFPPGGGWVIVTHKTHFARGIPDACFEALGRLHTRGAVTCVAFPPQGGDRWVILAGGALVARGIDDECYQTLCNCLPSTRPAQQVAFTPKGGWVVRADDYYWARGIPDECFTQLNAFHAKGMITDHVAFSASGGWSVIADRAIPARSPDTIRQIEQNFIREGGRWHSLAERMAKYKVPGVSVAAVIDNRVAWACNYGFLEAGGSDCVYSSTVFQAASVSKPVAAIGFLRLAQDQQVGLDDDINGKLEWTLPVCPSAKKEWKPKVTLRRLLRHAGGISGLGAPGGSGCNNFGGFGGYRNQSNVAVPTLKQVLNGTPPANSPAIQLTHEPGIDSYYSGPGYTVMQQLLEAVRNTDFATWMRDNVLVPSGMKTSTYSMVLPSAMARSAAGHDGNGKLIPGRRNRYPESAAAGLYTTASDLARFIILLNQLGQIDAKTVLQKSLATEMVQKGVGVPTMGKATDPNYVVWHNGANAGFRSLFNGYPNRKAGVAILTNADNGDSLHVEIATAVATAYGWNA